MSKDSVINKDDDMIRGLYAENKRLREALSLIANSSKDKLKKHTKEDPDWAKRIARDALR